MRVIDKIREKMGKYPDAQFKVEDNCIIFIPNTEDGFEVRLVADPYRYFVSFDGWHEEFEDEDEAMKCFGFGLSEKCRLKVIQRGRMRYRWLLEFKIDNEWRPETETGLMFFPFWLRKTELYLQNHIIKET